jgi:hypothetical protein
MQNSETRKQVMRGIAEVAAVVATCLVTIALLMVPVISALH